MVARSVVLSVLALASLAGNASAKQPPAREIGHEAQTAQRNKESGEAFLAANEGEEGVVTLETGLQYKILRAGEGAKPTLHDTVAVHYRGTLVDGTEFGSSYPSGKPGTFPLRAAIEGWRQALQLMPAGSKWQLFVPARLAFGERGAGTVVGPNATLIFEVELISVIGRDAKATRSGAVVGMEVSFKLDPRLTRSLYMGDRWVSPATFTSSPQGRTARVAAIARGIDASGKRVAIVSRWTAGDPEMVEVETRGGGEVEIEVKRPGESKLAVAFQGMTKVLTIKASERGGALAVEITQ